ncbi:major capsid protein [Variovorax sp. 350MFTsu5.1]|uniref:major capsid protein n=1 Tax=Variovorax sp. 350MFTsu5.1 TaxID=3158365 RepID=UPI003AB0BD72
MNKFARLSFRPAAVGAALLALGAGAHAALPEGAAEAINTYKTDVVAAIGLVIAAGIAVYAVKKLGQKMGWL